MQNVAALRQRFVSLVNTRRLGGRDDEPSTRLGGTGS